jgi:hypothetical protein
MKDLHRVRTQSNTPTWSHVKDIVFCSTVGTFFINKYSQHIYPTTVANFSEQIRLQIGPMNYLTNPPMDISGKLVASGVIKLLHPPKKSNGALL